MHNNHPEKRYLVSVVLAAFWGFVGAKEWYTNNKKAALLRLGATAAAIIASFLAALSSVVPGFIASLLVVALVSWLIIDSILTYRGANPQIKQQKDRASQTDKQFAKLAVILSVIISVLIGSYFLSQGLSSLSTISEKDSVGAGQVEDFENFTKLTYGSSIDEVASIMGSRPTCAEEQRSSDNISQITGVIISVNCQYDKTQTDDTSDSQSSDANYVIRLHFRKSEGAGAFSLSSKSISEILY